MCRRDEFLKYNRGQSQGLNRLQVLRFQEPCLAPRGGMGREGLEDDSGAIIGERPCADRIVGHQRSRYHKANLMGGLELRQLVMSGLVLSGMIYPSGLQQAKKTKCSLSPLLRCEGVRYEV